MTHWLWLAFAGALGTLSRFTLSEFVKRTVGSSFAWGTLTVNVIGCFLFGLVWTLSKERDLLSEEHRLIVLTGFMGAFTTFSTFAFETGDYLREDDWFKASANFVGQNALGLACVFLGSWLARWK